MIIARVYILVYNCVIFFFSGEHMLKIKAVKDPLQMGFHLFVTGNPGSGKPSQSTVLYGFFG